MMKSTPFSSQSIRLESVQGSIERVTFHSEESGFCVLRTRVKGHRDLVTVIGNAASVSPGEFIEGIGQWVSDKTHGLQFKAKELRIVQPSTLEGIEKYLGSGMIRGIGPHFAKRLVKQFGDSVFEVIEKEPHRLKELSGIGIKRQEGILKAWSEQKIIRHIMVFLQSHGVGTSRAVRIYKTYGETAIEKVQEDPYRLALDIIGIGFKTADVIAGRLGIAKDSLIRARAGILHVLQTFSGEGHCAALQENLVAKATELLEIPETIISQAIEQTIQAGHVYSERVGDKTYLFLMALFQSEMFVAEHLQRLSKGQPTWGEIDTEKALAWAESKTHCTLSLSQRQAVTQAIQSKVMVITGGPGVGKTTVVKTLLTILQTKRIRILVCAPTGRAAKRLSEATGLEAKTIHRQLEFQPNNYSFKYNHHHPWETDLVIVDESSMLDITLMNHLLKAIPSHASLLLIGDVDQLPSVGPGAVLSDIIQSKQVPTVFLKEIFRQAAHSRIIVNAHRINQGMIPLYAQEEGQVSDFYFIPAETPEMIHDKLLHIVAERIPQRFKLDPLRDIQVLTPMNRGGIGARALNVALQERLNSASLPKVSRLGWTFAPRDKVMQLVNNYDKNVFNGDIGIIESIDLEESTVTVQFDDRGVAYDFNELDELCLAYATSIHKSQGSEYPAVVIPLAMQHYKMLARNLLYTGVTRGKQLVILIGQIKAVAIAVHQVQAAQRLTRLADRIKR